MTYPRRRTHPLPREQLAPIGAAPVPEPEDTRPALEEVAALARADEDATTMMRCPVCRQGLVPPEVAAAVERALAADDEENDR